MPNLVGVPVKKSYFGANFQNLKSQVIDFYLKNK